MNNKQQNMWQKILARLAAFDTKTKVMALIAFAVTIALYPTLPFLPAEQRIFGLLICAIVLVVILIAIVRVELADTKANATGRNEAPHEQSSHQSHASSERRPSREQQSDEEPVAKLVENLREKQLNPNLIVAIARGGLIAAGYLSKQLTKQPSIPVISLWRTKEKEADYDNSFNKLAFNRHEFDRNTSDEINILIVDGFCVRGRTLQLAEEYVKRSIKCGRVGITTAAVILQKPDKRFERKTQTRPSFVGLETEEEIYAFGEKE